MTAAAADKKKRAALVRTSIQVPASVLDALAKRWPDRSLSERIRLALERHEGMMTDAEERTLEFRGTHGEIIAKALAGFTDDEWRGVMKALPQLLGDRNFVESLSGDDAEAIAGAAERVAILDAELAMRDK